MVHVVRAERILAVLDEGVVLALAIFQRLLDRLRSAMENLKKSVTVVWRCADSTLPLSYIHPKPLSSAMRQCCPERWQALDLTIVDNDS